MADPTVPVSPRQPVRLVWIEDDPGECAFLQTLLENDGLACTLERVEDETAFIRAVQSLAPDLILARFDLPAMAGLRALDLREQFCPTTPLIFVSGAPGERVAIDALKRGAADFVLKESVARLPAAVRGALHHAHQQRVQRAADRHRQAHVWFLENLDRVNRAIQGSDDVEQMMSDVLETILSIFECDRAWLLYPCNPLASSWSVPMERTRPEYPGALARGTVVPMDAEVGARLRLIAASDGLVRFGPGSEHTEASAVDEKYGILSTLCICIRPRAGDPWVFGLHQCSHARTWTTAEEQLFQESGRRLTDGLTTLLTMRKERDTNARLLWQTAFFEAQVESAIDGILVVDAEGKKVLQNAKLSEIWKFPPHVVEARDDTVQVRYTVSRARYPEQFAERVAYLYAHPDEVSRDEVELVDGTILDSYSSPVRDRSGKHYGRIWTFRDITSRRQLEEQFRQAQKMEAVGQLAGGIAHDFNNLLSVIQMQSSILLTSPSTDAETTDGLQEIAAAAERAANLTRQLLNFSRRSVSEAREIDLAELTGKMTSLFRRLLGDDITLESQLSPALPRISADAGMMEQVLMNLVVNARDAMPAGGRLTVSLELVVLDDVSVAAHPSARIGRFVRLGVSDTGSGIPPELLSRVFEPFFTTKEVGKGTGLGLASVFGIVDEHQGWIEVTSVVGQGATFLVYLPALDGPVAKIPAAADRPIARSGTETILLAEDDTAVRNLVCAVLRRHGYHVLEASSGAAAVTCWENRETPIHLLLTDLVMPGGMSGGELARELMARQPGLKVIYTSGYSNELVNRQLELEQGRNFIPKPCSAFDIADTVRRRLDEPDRDQVATSADPS